MNILNTHIYELRFYIDNDAPEEYINRWKELKLKCENGDNKIIVEKIKSYCKLSVNKELPYLERSEGGLGGNNNKTNKQIRFREYFGNNDYRYKKDNDIILQEITSSDNEKWTYDELDDLVYAFIKTANFNIKADCVNGYITMFNKRMLNDNYLESDDE